MNGLLVDKFIISASSTHSRTVATLEPDLAVGETRTIVGFDSKANAETRKQKNHHYTCTCKKHRLC